jgi:hypothetical protein
MFCFTRLSTAASALLIATFPFAPSAQTTAVDTVEVAAPGASVNTEGLMTAEELETLVAPVALYPDTLLIQILVAATYPLEVIKADQYVDDNAETDAETLKANIEAEDWDESVSVLATAFPDVLSDMADHIDWTETIGTAMLAQDEDVLSAVQVMRAEAQAAGNLESGDEQTVEVTQEDNGDQTIIIQPADPQVVYVPQYDTQKVYVQDTSSNNAATSALMFFGTAVLINEIFDDDDYWGGGYWGCRNCGGWNGRPIVRSPDIDLDVDGNVNIGNRVGDIGGGDRTNIAWKPDERRQTEARDKISKKRNADGGNRLPERQPNRGDDMRDRLSDRSGAADISRPANRDALSNVQRPDRDALKVPDRNKAAIDRTKRTDVADRAKAVNRPAAAKPKVPSDAKAKVAAKKPTAKPRQIAAKKPERKVAPAQKTAIKKHASASKSRAGAKRGKAAKGKARRR